MTMASAVTPVLDRGRAAMDHFSKLLSDIAGIDAATADRVTGLYLKHKLATIDYGSSASGPRRASRPRAPAAERGAGRARLSSKDVAAACAMMRDPEITIAEIAKRLRVGVSTLYRYLPGGRGSADEQPKGVGT
jgi:hypothetical protein